MGNYLNRPKMSEQSKLDMLADLDIVLMASGGPDLETLVRRGVAAHNAHLETLENRIFAGREVQCIGTRGGEKDCLKRRQYARGISTIASLPAPA